MKRLFLGSIFCSLVVGCSGGDNSNSGTEHKTPPSGQSSVTIQGSNVSRTTLYGTESGTVVYCSHFRSGETSILLKADGENRNNSGWMKDGVSFSFYGSIRPQDVSEIGTSNTNVFVVIKEMPEGGTFNLDRTKCSFKADSNGDDLSIRFDCPALYRDEKSISVYGWAKCKLVQQNF